MQDGVTVQPGLFLQLNVDSKVRGDDGTLVDMCWALDNDMCAPAGAHEPTSGRAHLPRMVTTFLTWQVRALRVDH